MANETYWDLVEPYWDQVSIYDGSKTFLAQFATLPKKSADLYATHWCQDEVANGGFEQFFSNSTGVLAPEAVEGFRRIGMPQTAALLEEAMGFFDEPYPRERGIRENAIEDFRAKIGGLAEPFQELDQDFSELIETENGGFEQAADRYASAS